MNIAYDQNKNFIHAKLSVKGATYLCPNCSEIVVRAGGSIQRPHFRHKVGGGYESCEFFVMGLEDEIKYGENDFLFVHQNENLIENVDYTILSYEIEDLNRKKIPFPRFCNMDQDQIEVYNTEKIFAYLDERRLVCRAIIKICHYPSIEQLLFKIKDLDVDINAAIDIGFGVLKLHTGRYAGQKFMFDPQLLNYKGFSNELEVGQIVNITSFNSKLRVYKQLCLPK